MTCRGNVFLAHVNQVGVPDALGATARDWWCVVLDDVGVLAVGARVTSLWDRAGDSNAVLAELGDLGDVSVPQARVPYFRSREHTHVQSSVLVHRREN